MILTALIITPVEVKNSKIKIALGISSIIIAFVLMLVSQNIHNSEVQASNEATNAEISKTLKEKYDVELLDKVYQDEADIKTPTGAYTVTTKDDQPIQITLGLINAGEDIVAFSNGIELPKIP